MNNQKIVDLYELLPALYRLRDTEQGYPLRAFLEIIAEQVDIVRRDIDGLWDDFFIETCANWVIPYIGDLVGNDPLHGVAKGRRADVAHTIYYRRRKGTLPMLEELARDVTGWGVHAVGFFELLGWTQHLNHLRYRMAPNSQRRNPNAVDRVGTVNLRNLDALDRLDGPFDIISHSVDLRTIGHTEGWHNIRKVGFFLWRLGTYPMADITPRQSSSHPHGYHFSPLGNPAPLFNEPEREADEAGLAGEIHVPGPIRPLAFYFDLKEYQERPEPTAPAERPPDSDYYGPHRSLNVIKDDTPVPPMNVICKDLHDWDRPPAGKVAVDVRLGRLTFAEGEEPTLGVKVAHNYGFSADIGGGPYDRRYSHLRSDSPAPTGSDTVANPDALDVLIRVPSGGINTIGDALAAWDPAANPQAVIQIDDNRTYQENMAINIAGNELVIQAANRRRPTLIGDVTVTGADGEGRLALNGLLIEGSLKAQGSLRELDIIHCTLVPGRGLDEEGQPRKPERPSVIGEATNVRLQVKIDHSIVGPLRLPAEIVALRVQDSVLDSPTRGGRAGLIPTLLSGDLAQFPSPSSASPVVNVTIGDEGPHTAVFFGVPATLAQARHQLQAAIHAAHSSAAFREARVLSTDNRLIVLPGAAGDVSIGAAGADPTATELRLDHSSARQMHALVTGPLSPFPTLSSSSPAVNATIGTEDTHTAMLASVPTTLTQACAQLQAAIRAAHTTPAFTAALVANFDDQLIVLPGAGEAAVVFSPAPTDQTTLTELALESDRPAIAASDGGGQPAPSTTLERTTVFGAVHVKELTLASVVIFNDPVVAQRRQAGCVRFSYVPDGSRTPRRYRCQPDLALESVTDPGEQACIRARLTPLFTSIHYGDPAYAQLSLACAEEIRTGAEDSSEMGALSHLKQAQREANLRMRLGGYLPFGLEPGLIYVT